VKTHWKGNSFLFSALEGDEWLASGPDRFTATKEPLHKRRRGPQSPYGLFGEEIRISLPKFETQSFTAYPSRHTVCAVLATYVCLMSPASTFPASIVRDSTKLTL